MDFRKFGLVILILGIIVLCYGAIQFGANQPKKFDKSESKTSIFGGADDLGNWMETQSINSERKHKRDQAANIMIAGAIVLLIGGGVRFSAKSTKNDISETNKLDIGAWFSRNIKIISGIVGVGVVLFGIYYFLLKPNPIKDAKNVATAFCDCSSKYNEAIIEVNEEFIRAFDEYRFSKRQEARIKLQELQNSANSESSNCNSTVQQKYSEIRNRYITDKELLEKFDFAYNAQSRICNPSNQSKFMSTNSEVESKILSIKDPEPDIEKIKNDILGQKIPGWSFDYLNEFENAEILNKSLSNDRLEYQVKFVLKDNNNGRLHDCEVMIVYLQSAFGWSFSKMDMMYITYTNTFYPDKYISITPLANCNWNAENTYKMSWKTSNYSYANETITGPDLGAKTLPYSTEYYIKSLTGKEIKVKFTYRPKK